MSEELSDTDRTHNRLLSVDVYSRFQPFAYTCHHDSTPVSDESNRGESEADASCIGQMNANRKELFGKGK
jgi:hypothetical protein